MNATLCRLFGWPSGPVATQVEIFARTMSVISAMAAVAHIVFLLIFSVLGVKELAALNVLSIATYFFCIWLVRKRPFATEALIGLEIVVHGLAAVYLVGWESGFHFYIILIVPTAIVSGGSNARENTLARWVGGFGAAALYSWMDAAMRSGAPAYQLPLAVQHSLRMMNLAGTFVIMGLLALVYRQLILQAESVLRHQASTDPLTQLHNRRSALEVVQRELAVYSRQARPLAVILGDVDHFKAINDQYGHHAGDLVLQSVARVLQGAVREMDDVARWGGEEFLVVLPGTDVDEAYAVAERLRAAVAAQVCHVGKGPIPVTITLGLADLRPGDTVEQLISRADQALYRGKQSGRNQVMVDTLAVNRHGPSTH